jgi:hypothetical protein
VSPLRERYDALMAKPGEIEAILRDGAALLLAFAGCLASLYWSFGFADRSHGHLWPQILATSVGYGVFLAVLTGAFYLRRRMLATG